ncbi:MAG: hypothetical protein JRG96_12915 [Deltaproteobacteria bacterium]|nr:hypothetical protein [Deltaproteobacteria bacterium]
MRSASALSYLLSLLLTCAPAAGAVDFETTDTPVPALKLDLAVPESPGFTALGLTPENVQRPATIREFATGLLSGLDKNGNFQVGLAIDVAPYMMIRGDQLTIRKYRNSTFHRYMARTQLSLATTKGTSKNDKSLRLGLGLRTTLWDRGDPRSNEELEGCLMGDEMGIPLLTDFSSRDEWLAAVDARFEKVQARADECLLESEKRLWNASAWDIAAAPTWIQEGGTSADLSWGGATFWTSVAYGFEEARKKAEEEGEESWFGENAQLIGHLRFRLDELSPVASGLFVKEDTVLAGARFRAGKSSLTFSVEGSYVYQNPEIGASSHGYEAALHSDIKIVSQTWLNLGLGVTGGNRDTRILVSAGLKWGGRNINLAGLAKTLAPMLAKDAGGG